MSGFYTIEILVMFYDVDETARLDARSFLCVSYYESEKNPFMHILTSDND